MQSPLRIDKDAIGKTLLIFNCNILGCTHELRVPPAKIDLYTGYCTSCLRKKKPFEVVFNRMRENAKYKGIKHTLSYEEFLEFTKIQNCFYCDSLIPWRAHTMAGNIGGMGYFLDRKDSELGYSKDNCVVCCYLCNKTKNNSFGFEEFQEIGKVIKRILQNRIS
jgi:hypothetical protein